MNWLERNHLKLTRRGHILFGSLLWLGVAGVCGSGFIIEGIINQATGAI